jgi:hypothetical protein
VGDASVCRVSSRSSIEEERNPPRDLNVGDLRLVGLGFILNRRLRRAFTLDHLDGSEKGTLGGTVSLGGEGIPAGTAGDCRRCRFLSRRYDRLNEL